MRWYMWINVCALEAEYVTCYPGLVTSPSPSYFLIMSRRSPSKDVDGLSLQERLFVKSYIANNGNGQRAAADAAYTGDCAKRARDLLDRERVCRNLQQSARAILSPVEARSEHGLC